MAIWQNRPHSGLRHPAMPKKDLTPNEAFAALAGVAPQIPVTLDRDDYIALLPVAWRTIQPYGINFESLHYDAPELHEYRGTPSGLPSPANGRWEIRHDPYRIQSIYVRDHRKKKWIEAQWSLTRHLIGPFSLDVLTAAKKALGKRTETVPGRDLLAEINRIMTAPASRAEAQAARRASTTGPAVPMNPMPPHDGSAQELRPSENAAPPFLLPGRDAAEDAPARRRARRIDLLED